MASWVVKALVDATPISGPASVRRWQSTSRARALGHVDQTDRGEPEALDVAHRGERVRGLARLRHEQRRASGHERRVAVAELGADVQVDRQAGQLLEPVLGDHAGVVRGAARHHDQPGQGGEVDRQLWQGDAMVGRAREGAQRIADHGRLLVDLLVHEVAVVALADQRAGHRRLLDLALHRLALGVIDGGAAGVQHCPVAFLQVLDAIGQRRERQGVGAEYISPSP